MSYAFWFRQDHEKNVHQAPWVPRSSWQQGEFPLYSNQEAPHDLEMIHHPDETDRRSGKQQHFRKRWKFDFYRTIGKVKGQKSHATNHGALAPVPTAGAASRGRPKDAQSPNHWHLASFFPRFSIKWHIHAFPKYSKWMGFPLRFHDNLSFLGMIIPYHTR